MYLNSEGIIFRQTKATGGRRMILLFTKKYGKISVGTSMSEKARTKSSLAMRPFTYGNYQIFQGRTYYNLDKADTIKSFYGIGEDLDKFMYGSYVLELTEKLVPEELAQPAIFDLLIEFMEQLELRKKSCETLVLAYEVRILKILGMFPELRSCVSCGSKEELDYFSVRDGGIMCRNCAEKLRSEGEDSLIYDGKFGIVDILNYFASNSLGSFSKIALDDGIADRLQVIIKEYISYHLDVGNLKSESLFAKNI
ncbi:DNA repair protein RecO [Aminicella lysinilytica]|uniref:DNA repair protein RecO n=1 Tax=Aminicella lysinilytica TaxID=433323 RepID=A0A4R6Q3T1_9FIRM|nr:DNA repair protein RecO [Aminicella lysinilytica]TDP54589.1 DNA replication and repair protein RecO [Aminicella lysinilytica]